MSTYRFAKIPSNGSVAAVVTLAVSAWFTLAGAAMLTNGHAASAPESQPQHAVLMEEAAPASPTPLPVAANTPDICEKIVVERPRLVAVPTAYEKIVVEAVREHA